MSACYCKNVPLSVLLFRPVVSTKRNPPFFRRTQPSRAKRVQINPMTGLRMDAWLWAARFFKTRTLAKKACDLGRIVSKGQPAKAAREVRVGDMLRITNDGGDFEIEVLGLSEIRGPASEAQKLYRETERSKELRQKAAAERKASREWEILPAGRPSKRDRRRIIQFRGRG